MSSWRTGRLRRAVVLATLVGLSAAGSAQAWAKPGPAEQLGAAYQAFSSGDYHRALQLGRAIASKRLQNPDYLAYLLAQSAYLTGDFAGALVQLERLAGDRDSRFRGWARWRMADCQWALGRIQDSAKSYARLIGKGGPAGGDEGLARYRLAESAALAGQTDLAIRRFKELRLRHPAHTLEPRAAERLRQLGGEVAARLSYRDRIERAILLRAAKKWREGIAELRTIPDDAGEEIVLDRDFWMAMTLFNMRRRYQRAADILLEIYPQMGDRAAEALFHGARAMSRVDRDAEAIVFYQKLVELYPGSYWAPEAQFLSGWLEYNLGNYERALPHLAETRRRYGRSKYARNVDWYSGFSLYLLGRYDKALPYLERVAKQSDRLEGGMGHYWRARSLQKLGKQDQALADYRALVGRYPLSWYAHLARARLAEAGQTIDPFGETPRAPGAARSIDDTVDPALARDPLIRRVDELIAAGLGVFAGEELRRGERAFLTRHPRNKSLAMALDRYRKAGNYHRPWMIAISWGGSRALDAPPKGPAKVWWEHSLPLAYRELVDRYQDLGGSPDYYLYSIMRKESGFDPHTHSYANAIGLLQMIPRTTRIVARELGLTYTDDFLFDPALNIQVGSWYIGRLLKKFRGQIPLGAGSFNSGPRPVMRWIDKNGDRPIDEMVELVSYSQTRGYMKKVTEIYSRYLLLYKGEVYQQPLVVEPYLVNDLTY